jgi:hypothetical protein
MVIESALGVVVRTAVQMDHPRAFGQVDHLGITRVVAAGIDVNSMAEPGEVTSELQDVDVHSPGVLFA